MGEERYLRMWVRGKTGERWLIAKHECLGSSNKLQRETAVTNHFQFDELIDAKSDIKLFAYPNGEQPVDLNKLFAQLLREMRIQLGINGTNITLCSVRHTYATNELL